MRQNMYGTYTFFAISFGINFEYDATTMLMDKIENVKSWFYPGKNLFDSNHCIAAQIGTQSKSFQTNLFRFVDKKNVIEGRFRIHIQKPPFLSLSLSLAPSL